MSENAYDISYTRLKLFGNEVLLSDERIDKETLPEGLYCYDIRHSDNDWDMPVTIEKRVVANWYGSILSKVPIELNSNLENPNDPYRRVSEDDFTEKYRGITLSEWMHENRIRVVIVEPMKEPRIAMIDNTYETHRDLVGGIIQTVHIFNDNACVVCNDEGKLMNLPPNRYIRDDRGVPCDVLCGTFFVVGTQGDEFSSLTEKQAEHYKNMYSKEMLISIPKDKKPKQHER